MTHPRRYNKLHNEFYLTRLIYLALLQPILRDKKKCNHLFLSLVSSSLLLFCLTAHAPGMKCLLRRANFKNKATPAFEHASLSVVTNPVSRAASPFRSHKCCIADIKTGSNRWAQGRQSCASTLFNIWFSVPRARRVINDGWAPLEHSSCSRVYYLKVQLDRVWPVPFEKSSASCRNVTAAI